MRHPLPSEMPKTVFRIGLVMAHSLTFYRDILRGVKAFAVERPGWVLTPIAPERQAIELARPLRCDGYLAHVFTLPLARALLALRKPVVSVAGVLPELPMPHVMVDHAEVGRQAARHFVERGVRRFGFVGYPRHAFPAGGEVGSGEGAAAPGWTLVRFLSRQAGIRAAGGSGRGNRPRLTGSPA